MWWRRQQLLEWSTIPFCTGINYIFFLLYEIGIERVFEHVYNVLGNGKGIHTVRLHLQQPKRYRETMRKRNNCVRDSDEKLFRKNRGLAFCVLNVLSDAIWWTTFNFQNENQRTSRHKMKKKNVRDEEEKNIQRQTI